jgi:Raf kinase inhibitor-like YbhB/YbcL family protein
MPSIGALIRNRRAGQDKLAWNLPNLAGPESLDLRSPAVPAGSTMPMEHVARRAGGDNVSPPLTWDAVPPGTAELLLVVEDPDAPTPRPWVHCVALLDAGLTELTAGALGKGRNAPGVRVLRATMGRGYQGPEALKGHGPHRYVFQLFALPEPLPSEPGGKPVERAKPRRVLEAARGPALARGRWDVLFER